MAESQEILARIRQVAAQRDSLGALAREATGTERRIFEDQAWQRQMEAQNLFRELGQNLRAQKEKGLDISGILDPLQTQVMTTWPRFKEVIREREERINQLLAKRDAASDEDLPGIERQFSEEALRLVRAYQALSDVTVLFEDLGLDVAALRAFASESLKAWADRVAAAVRIALREKNELSEQLAGDPQNTEIKAALDIVEMRLDRATDALSSFASSMDRLDLDTTEYRQLLFMTTGELTAEVLDRDVALGLFKQWRAELSETISKYGTRWLLRATVFLVILIAFWILAWIVRFLVRRSVASSRLGLSQLLKDTLVSWSSRVVLLVGLLIAISQLGVEIGPLLAGLGIAGFVLGFALQSSLANFAAGAMILGYQPFDVGDVIEAAGVIGKVRKMSLVSTTVLTFDNQTLIVPNSKIWDDVIRNVTAQSVRRVDMTFGISYECNHHHAREVLLEIVKAHEKVLKDPEPIVRVNNLGESSVDFIVRPWARTEDYWDVYWDITDEVKTRFDQEGISIPYPQRDLHLRLKPDDSGNTGRAISDVFRESEESS